MTNFIISISSFRIKMYTMVVVRYGEIFLKGEFVKRQLEDRLIENIRLKLGKDNLGGDIIRRRHRVYIKTRDARKVAESLRNIFGIVSVSPAIETGAEIEEICRAGLDLAYKVIGEGEGFAVQVKRAGKHEYSSGDVERVLGGRILENIKAHVNLTSPDKTIFVEILDKQAFVFDNKIRCVGGLPYKTQGRAVALISRGIDSQVASWMMMRRGCEIIALHFETGGGVAEALETLGEFSGRRIECYVIPYNKILKEISGNSGDYACVVCKRTMLRIAERIVGIENAHGIVTGERLDQAAGHTLEDLEVINEITSPVYMPLIGRDREEITRMAGEIGIQNLCREAACNLRSRKPATRCSIEEISEIEEGIGIKAIVDEIDLECLKR